MRRVVVIATLLLAGGVVFYFWPRGRSGAASEHRAGRAATESSPVSATDAASAPFSSGTPGPGAPLYVAADFPIAATLNASDSNIARDLEIVQALFENWITNFPHEGNPVGENAEITAALMGENRLDLKLIPKGHRALNAQGELCDRWGTPFRFHQLSGTKMEVRSAGPDRKFATEDDSMWTPQ